MRTFSLARKLTATLHLLWFALYVGVPQFVHPCPEHMAQAGAAAESAQQSPPGGHAHHGAPSSADDPANEECCCPGPHCGVAAMVASGSRALVPGVVAAAALRPAADRFEVPRGRRAHTLPFATAPPARSA